MGTINLLDGKIVLNVERGGGSIATHLARIECPVCGDPACNTCWCGPESEEKADDAAGRLMYNGAVDAIESLLLALACAGAITQSEDPKVNEAIQTALDAYENNF